MSLKRQAGRLKNDAFRPRVVHFSGKPPRYYMHNNMIAHRDLKPENFLLQNKEDVMKAPLKIIDFGLARKFDPKVPPREIKLTHRWSFLAK